MTPLPDYYPEEQLKIKFPKLRENISYTNHSKCTRDYNCIAWAVGVDYTKYWPIKNDAHYSWFPDIPYEATITNFILFFLKFGYTQCEDGSLNDEFEKVALYGQRTLRMIYKPTHAAKQLPDGKWTSKLGIEAQDIIHNSESDICGREYGDVIMYFSRKKIIAKKN